MTLAWTSEAPTVPGWYWAQLDHRWEPEAVSISEGYVEQVMSEYPEKVSFYAGARWYGPLEVPEG